jgi:hypothetical protein
MKETREGPKLRRPRFEATNSRIAGAVLVIGVIAILVVSTLLVFSFINEEGDGLKPKETIFFSASDGAVINASWYPSSTPGSPTIYLIHDIGQDRTIWNDYALELQGKGYNVMAIDTRGHGESTKNIIDPNVVYDFDGDEEKGIPPMSHYELELVRYDIDAAYTWVQGETDGVPNTEAGKDGAFIGIGKGGLFAMKQYATMSAKRIVAGCIISPTLDVFAWKEPDVIQIFEDWGDIRPIIMARSEGDGNAKAAMDRILTLKDEDEEKNGIGFIVPGSYTGIHLLRNIDLKDKIVEVFDATWGISPG